MDQIPSLEDFLVAPLAKVAAVAPATLVFAAGGTRRSAILAGVDIQSDDYVAWSREQMIACMNLLFQHGVTHIFTHAIIDSQLNEVTTIYRERLLEWVKWGVAGPEALADYARLNWRARLIGVEGLPELQDAAQQLVEYTPKDSRHTLWWTVVPSLENVWNRILTAAQTAQTNSRETVVQALYGEIIPPVRLLLSFGKPIVSPALIPPLLMGQVQCYWMQRPGYQLSEADFRRILYDYAYQRVTWREDKTGRAEMALKHRKAWEEGPTIGLGITLGPFWYPQPFSLPDDTAVND